MKKFLLFVLFISPFAFAGELSFEHKINVPADFSYGRSSEPFEGTSLIERYVHTYEKCWWKTVRNFVEVPNKWETPEFYIISGWASESNACLDAYTAASFKVHELVKTYGLETVRDYAKEQLEPKT